jgi:hypothetical protein
MTGNELKLLRLKLGLTVKSAAASLKKQKSPRTWFRWEAFGDTEIHREAIDLFVAATKRRLNRIETSN